LGSAAARIPAILVLEDGTTFEGTSIGAEGRASGEVCFNTAYTGYQEILTDPSYARQIVCLTYPHVGNVGTNPEDAESRRVFASGLVIRDLPVRSSSWRARDDLTTYLRDRGVVAIADVDTRRLTRILREKGAQRGCIAAGSAAEKEAALAEARSFPGLEGMDLAASSSVEQPFEWTEGKWTLGQGFAKPEYARFRVVAYDFGMKLDILRILADRGCRVEVVPAKTPAEEILDKAPDGVFLSNGPGDPEPCAYAVDAIQKIVATQTPTFGICLGHQLLALASGAKTEKMKFGHHGANHPVLELDSKRVMITSQNHGFCVAEDSLPENLKITHRSLFDRSIQGVHRTDAPAFGFQGHPEASPGPNDAEPLFDHFIDLMSARKG
jgi:carbamoyl-phosphate synthase small subunit